MNTFLICFINGLYKEYKWLQEEYNKSWNNPLKYSELTPKEIKIIINKYEYELHQDLTKKLKFEKVIHINIYLVFTCWVLSRNWRLHRI